MFLVPQQGRIAFWQLRWWLTSSSVSFVDIICVTCRQSIFSAETLEMWMVCFCIALLKSIARLRAGRQLELKKKATRLSKPCTWLMNPIQTYMQAVHIITVNQLHCFRTSHIDNVNTERRRKKNISISASFRRCTYICEEIILYVFANNSTVPNWLNSSCLFRSTPIRL